MRRTSARIAQLHAHLRRRRHDAQAQTALDALLLAKPDRVRGPLAVLRPQVEPQSVSFRPRDRRQDGGSRGVDSSGGQAVTALTTFDSLLKDMYPLPDTPLKQSMRLHPFFTMQPKEPK